MATQDTPSAPRNSREVLAERLRSLTYEVDHTAANPANHVVETRTLTDANRSPFNHIIPKAAPFFAHTVRIFHTQTNDELINGQDFYCVGTFVKAVTNVVDHREVCWAIIFDDKRISGEYRIEYQTVGGEFVLDQQQMAEILANFVENPRTADWEQVIGRPLTFPPLPHDIHVDQLKGFNEQVEATHGVEQAIRALLRDEEQDHPGYGQVITELFRQQQRQDKFQQILDNMRAQNTQSLSGLEARLTNEDNRIEKESKARDADLERRLTTDFQAKLDRMDAAYKEADSDLTGKLNKVKTDLTSDINAKDTALRQLIEQKDTAQTRARSDAVSALNATLNSTASTLREEMQNADRGLDRKIESLRTSTTTAIASALGDAKTYTDTKYRELINSLNTNIGRADGATSLLGERVNENKRTSDANEAALRRDLTAEINNRTTADTALGQRIDALSGSLNTKERALSDRINEAVGNHNSLQNNFNALKGRIDRNDELVKMSGDQLINGTKTFAQTIALRNVNNAAESATVGFNNTNVFIHNPHSQKTLQLNNDGTFVYDRKRILLQPDLDNINNTINAVRNSLGNYVPTNGNHTINNEKTFTSRIRAPRIETDNVGYGAFLNQYSSAAPFYVNHFNNNNISTYYPFVKGRIQNNGNGWGTAISFGALGHQNENKFPDAIIHARGDSGDHNNKIWRFDATTGDFVSTGDIITGSNISLNNAVLKSGDQNIEGVKSFKHWVRVRRSDNDGLYSEWSFEPTALFRYWADGRDRIWVNNDGRFYAPRGLSIGNTANRNDSNYRWSEFTVNWNDADPFLSLTGSGGGAAAANYGRLSVHDLYVRSDKRIKHDIEKITDATSKIEAINGYTYFLNGSKTKSGGVIAQELIEVMPEIVHLRHDREDEQEYYSVQYHGVIALLIEALKESNERIRILEEKFHV